MPQRQMILKVVLATGSMITEGARELLFRATPVLAMLPEVAGVLVGTAAYRAPVHSYVRERRRTTSIGHCQCHGSTARGLESPFKTDSSDSE